MSQAAPVTISSDEFARDAGPFRGELLAHCYRLLGTLHDAEDAVQETLLRAWRSYDRFEGRSSLRVWLYRIATNTCLTALERDSRRPLPSAMGESTGDPDAPLARALGHVTWLQPLPDALTDDESGNPAAVAVSRSSVRLALVAAMQHLPPRQRAVLILRDVLAWRTSEVAEFLDTTTVSVKSALQRARSQLSHIAPAEDETLEPSSAEARALLDRYMTAFENADVDTLALILRDDATFEMPPFLTWLAGRDTIVRFLASRVLGQPPTWRLVPTRANRQPAVAAYRRQGDGGYRAHAVQALTVTASGIAGVVSFLDPGLFSRFGLPLVQRSAPAR